MTFDKVVSHLRKRGFVTRTIWKKRSVLVFGEDNSPSLQTFDGREFNWSPNLSEMKAKDWSILPFFWKSPEDNFLPFTKGYIKGGTYGKETMP